MPDEYGNGSDGPLFGQEFHDSADTDLLVAEAVKPAGEFVGTLNLPSHVRLCHRQNNASRVILVRHGSLVAG